MNDDDPPEQTIIRFEDDPPEEPGDIMRNAHRWMDDNPDAMVVIERIALELAAKGEQFTIAHIAEIMRRDPKVRSDPESYFKITNAHRAYIARELVRRHPHLVNHMKFRMTKYERRATG